jgi:hypothetical protein
MNPNEILQIVICKQYTNKKNAVFFDVTDVAD